MDGAIKQRHLPAQHRNRGVSHAIEVSILKPRQGSRTVLTSRDAFQIQIRLRNMWRIAGKDCHSHHLGVYNLGVEMHFQTICHCWDEFEDHMQLAECYVDLWSGQLGSSMPNLEVHITNSLGEDVASTSTTFSLVCRNDTELLQLIEDHTSSEPNASGVLDELRWLQRLSKAESKTFSQNSEDGVIVEAFRHFGSTDKLAVEFGAEDGKEVNSRVLWEQHGWRGILLDGDHDDPLLHPNASLHRAFITPGNVVSLLRARGVPREFDLLSLDLDFNDFWVLLRLLRAFRPRIVVAEINRNLGPDEPLTVPVNSSLHWTGAINRGFPHGTAYFGMSAGALDLLATASGYKLAYVFLDAVNALLVRNDLLAPGVREVLSLRAVMAGRAPGIHALYDGAQTWVEVSEGGEEGELAYAEGRYRIRNGHADDAGSIQDAVWPRRYFEKEAVVTDEM